MRLLFSSRAKSWVAFCHDLVMVAVSFIAALALRLDYDVAWKLLTNSLLPAWGLFVVIGALTFWRAGLYKGVWRYASMNDLMNIIKAVTLALLIFLPVLFFWNRLESFPRSSLLINWFVLVFLLGGSRLVYRMVKDNGVKRVFERNGHLRVPVLLIGADDLAEAFVRHMARDPQSNYEVVGLLDPSGEQSGRRIHDIPITGPLDRLEEILDACAETSRAPQRLVLSRVPDREAMQKINALAEARGLRLDRLPNPAEFKAGDAAEIEVRPIAIEDLLGRQQATLDRPAMRALIEGRRVMVTGAGGSIGSELARQIAGFGPAELVLLDGSEFNLYNIDLELSETHAEIRRFAVIGDVRDRGRLDQVMARHQPELVFHAAALKHVPLVEDNPVEGVQTNTLGTRNTADACRAAGVKTMVLISTDKAINPPNIMGASKRLAESYCQALDLAGREDGGTRFVTVRFGNVLGSTGSVVPLFQRQLQAGGPLTVTHPEITRYFMTIREAVELVLQASTLATASEREDAGKIYVLDMGEPVKIADLARQVIRLGGFEPDVDVKVEYTGLRPGEKLYEELFHEHEPMVPTEHDSLKLASPRTTNLQLLTSSLDRMAELARERNREEVVHLLRQLVPEYSGTQGLEPTAPDPEKVAVEATPEASRPA